MSSRTIHRFCPACGAEHSPQAKFCGHCGAELRAVTSTPAGSNPPPAAAWSVAVGDALPLTKKKGRKPTNTKHSPQARAAVAGETAPKAKGRSIWGSTLFMAITQGADLMTRAMESGGENDQTLPLRLGLAAAVAVFGVTMRSTPLLRTILVRLGTLGIALLQGASLWTQLQGLIADPQLLQAALPNLGAQGASLLAVYRLFRQVGKR